MRKQHWPKRDPIKNYFPLPNEIFSLGLSAGAIAVYGFLLHREDRRTYQCVASYRTIGEAVGMSVNTVRKYVTELEDRGLIRTERTTVTPRDGRTLNGCLRYYILPIQMSINQYYQKVRFQQALELLGAHFTVTQVAEKLGFDSIHSFSRAFKNHFGQSPTSMVPRS